VVATLPGLRVGLNCTLELDEDDVAEGEGYKSRVEDFQGDTVAVAWPTKRGQNVNVAIGDLAYITVPTYDSRGQALPTLYLDGEIVGRSPGTAENVAMLTIRVLAVGRQQQRAHFRLYVTFQPIDCVIWHRDFGQAEAEGYWKPISAMVTDLSGGGVGLQSDDEVTEGTRVRLRFPYPMGSGDCLIEARVAKIFTSTQGGRTRYKVGTQFEQMDRTQREKLMRCIHRYQVEQRRRETTRR
jgi:c-di-GMP-binding flagellar brake protein YcgR